MPMKINKAKLLVGVLAVTAVAATVGSISGTFAWFQYNTRVTAAYEGAAAKCSENVQIRLYKPAIPATQDTAEIPAVYTEWAQDLRAADIAKFLGGEGEGSSHVAGARDAAANTLAPVTSGELEANKVADKLYRNPIYQYPDKTSWGEATAEADYIELPFQFRVLEVNGDTAHPTYLEKDLFLTGMDIRAKANTLDISEAIRVCIDNKASGDAAFTQTFSKTGVDVKVGGTLALGNDKDGQGNSTVDQTEGWEWTTGRSDVKYGDFEDEGKETPSVAKSQAITGENVKSTGAANEGFLLADDSNPHAIKGKKLLTTVADNQGDETKWASLTVRIYLEGWTELDSIKGSNATPKTVWDAVKALKGTTSTNPNDKPVFDVGLRFTAEAYEY